MAYALIGDVVGSRSLTDRAGAQRKINDALGVVSRAVGAAQPLEPTVGDEFQGVLPTLGAAVAASLLVRLELLPSIDVRCGLGQGDITVHDGRRRPVLQDGPAWWAARSALEELARPARRSARTWFSGLEQDHVNAYLVVRDALVERFNDRHLRMLRMALAGRTQAEIAAAEKISRSAVSQAFAHGVGAVRDAAIVFEGQPG